MPRTFIPKLRKAKEPSKKFEILEQTPDIKLKVFGSSPKELFKNTLYAMGYIQKPEAVEQSTVGKIIGTIRGKRVSEDFLIESMDYNTLLIDFLAEVLSISDSHNAVFFDVKFKDFSELKIEGKIYGVKVDDFSQSIKEAAYSDVDIKEAEPGKWESLLTLDI